MSKRKNSQKYCICVLHCDALCMYICNMPDIVSKIKRICQVLQERGEPGTPYQISRLLGVSPSTVSRWLAGTATPRGRQAQSLDFLYNTIVNVNRGNPEADKLLGALLGGVGAGLLGLGVGGVLIAAGLGWILGDQNERNTDG